MYAVSPRNNGYFPSASPISSPNAMNTPDSPVTPATGSVMNEATGMFDSAVGSPVMSLSITDYAADLTLLSEPLPEVMLLKPALAPVRPNSYTLAVSQHPHWPCRSIRRQQSCHAKGHLTLLPSRLTPVIILWSHSDWPDTLSEPLTIWRLTGRRMLRRLMRHSGCSCITWDF